MIETVCIRGHLERVGPRQKDYCQRRFPDGSHCLSPIANVFEYPEATDCGIREPHAPGAHPPVIDLTDPDEDECMDCALNPGLCDTHDAKPRHLDPWALGLPTPASSWIGVGLIVLCGLSIIASIYLAAKGHWLLALLV